LHRSAVPARAYLVHVPELLRTFSQRVPFGPLSI
jgi:hypothetical protein